MLRHTGDVLHFWVGFVKEIPKHGSYFSWETPWLWVWFSFFPPNFENLEYFCDKIEQKKKKKKGALFQKNPWTWEPQFFKNYPWTWVWVLSCWWHIPDQPKSENPPPTYPGVLNLRFDKNVLLFESGITPYKHIFFIQSMCWNKPTVSKIILTFGLNPRLTKLFFCNTSNQGGCYNPLHRFSLLNPLWTWFWYQ